MCEKVMCDDGIEREVVSRKEAKERGLKRYFTGKPCGKGHMSERRTGCATCCECKKRPKKPPMDGSRKSVNDDGVERPLINRKFARENNLKEYFTGEKCTRGHISVRDTSGGSCKKCNQDYYQENRETVMERSRRRHYENRDEILQKHKDYYVKNRERLLEYQREYQRNNRDKINDRRVYYRKTKYKEDVSYRLTEQCRNMMRRVLTATNSKKDNRTFEELGYNDTDLKSHLESLWLEGMNWDNCGKEWHVDHLYPVSRYIREGEVSPRLINRLDNLAPMWSEHNLEKKDRTLEEYLEDRPDLSPLYGRLL